MMVVCYTFIVKKKKSKRWLRINNSSSPTPAHHPRTWTLLNLPRISPGSLHLGLNPAVSEASTYSNSDNVTEIGPTYWILLDWFPYKHSLAIDNKDAVTSGRIVEIFHRIAVNCLSTRTSLGALVLAVTIPLVFTSLEQRYPWGDSPTRPPLDMMVQFLTWKQRRKEQLRYTRNPLSSQPQGLHFSELWSWIFTVNTLFGCMQLCITMISSYLLPGKKEAYSSTE